ncbi:MAG TPA: acyltransferase family protein [Mycobacteriales bacterium]|nr:acyltransferase family protein [Mycobacteriales bacterium]
MSATDVLLEGRAPAPDPASASPGRGFRPDVEGLRAVAVLLVVAFHAGIGVVSGGFVGVDVFFVISGFLITGLLVEEQRRSGTVSLRGFYARRIRRLLPLGTVVLLATTVATALALPAIDQPKVGGEATAAALWWANWHFAGSATQYMADVDLSPVLHYWSLSVEEQFYVVWPLLILLVTAGRRGLSFRVRRARLALALLVLGAASFVLSATTTASAGPWAYFGLHTRAWELAAGGLLALGLPLVTRVPRAAAALAGWIGLTLVAGSAVLLDRATVFPGTAAALPVGGTVLLLAAGAVTTGGVSRLMSTPWLTYVGRISYGWYLWHWPCLVITRAVWGHSSADPELGSASGPGPLRTTAAVGVSFLLAAVTYRLVERPVRESRTLARSRNLSLAMGALLVAVSVTGAQLLLGSPSKDSGLAVSAVPTAPGQTAPVKVSLQTPEQARKDTGIDARCFVDFATRSPDPACRFGDRQGSKVIVLIGDSHANSWFPAVRRVAEQQHWQLYYWAKAACAYADVRQFTTIFNREYTECNDYRAAVLERIRALPRVDAVLVGRNYSFPRILMDDQGETPGGAAALRLWREGARRSFASLATLTPRVVVLRDTPRPGGDVPGCLSKNTAHPQSCAFPQNGHTHLDHSLVDEEEQALPPGDTVRYIDLTETICPADPCSVLSPTGAILYRDLHHLTARFSRELAPALTAALLPIVRR